MRTTKPAEGVRRKPCPFSSAGGRRIVTALPVTRAGCRRSPPSSGRYRWSGPPSCRRERRPVLADRRAAEGKGMRRGVPLSGCRMRAAPRFRRFCASVRMSGHCRTGFSPIFATFSSHNLHGGRRQCRHAKYEFVYGCFFGYGESGSRSGPGRAARYAPGTDAGDRRAAQALYHVRDSAGVLFSEYPPAIHFITNPLYSIFQTNGTDFKRGSPNTVRNPIKPKT